MSESYFEINPKERKVRLKAAEEALDIPAVMLEKDIMVVWTLMKLWSSTFAASLMFAGGTMLSKCYDAIRRFSEDIDLIFDLNEINPERLTDGRLILPNTHSQIKSIERKVRHFLAPWVTDTLAPYLHAELAKDGIAAEVEVRASTSRTLAQVFIHYDALFEMPDPMLEPVKLELTGTSTFHGSVFKPVECYAAQTMPDLWLPSATGVRAKNILLAHCDKVDAVERNTNAAEAWRAGQARHYFDLAELHRGGHTAQALERPELLHEVAHHSLAFHRQGGLTPAKLDSGTLNLWPQGERRGELIKDYLGLLKKRVPFGQPLPVEEAEQSVREVEQLINALALRS